MAGVSTKGPVLSSLSTPCAAHFYTYTVCVYKCVCTYILTRLNPYFEHEMNNPIEIAAMFTLAQN